MKKSRFPLTFKFHADPPAGWDDFVMQCEPSHFEQTSWWANAESEDGWKARYVVGWGMDQIEAGAMALVRPQGKLGRIGYIVRGPLIGRDLSDSELVRRSLTTALKSLGRKEHLRLLVVVPPYNGTALTFTLLSMGFLRHPRVLPPSNLPLGTITVDLRRAPGEIEKGYRRTLRQEINRAKNKGVEVKLGGVEDLELFWSRHLELCQRRGVVPNVSGLSYVRRAWQEFSRCGRAWLFNARLGEEVLCSLICLGVGKWFYAWRIGWTPDSKKAYPTQAVFAQAIQTAAQAGYHYFDFMEIPPDDAASFERGEKPSTPTAGITFFKLGFGGKARILSPPLDWFTNPVLHLLMRCVGLRLLSSGLLRSLVRRSSPRSIEGGLR